MDGVEDNGKEEGDKKVNGVVDKVDEAVGLGTDASGEDFSDDDPKEGTRADFEAEVEEEDGNESEPATGCAFECIKRDAYQKQRNSHDSGTDEEEGFSASTIDEEEGEKSGEEIENSDHNG